MCMCTYRMNLIKPCNFLTVLFLYDKPPKRQIKIFVYISSHMVATTSVAKGALQQSTRAPCPAQVHRRGVYNIVGKILNSHILSSGCFEGDLDHVLN